MKIVRNFIIFGLILLCYSSGVSKDNELWLGYRWQYTINKDFSLRFANQVRIFRDATTVKQLLHDFGVRYSVADFADLTVFYRLQLKHQDPSKEMYQPFHEINLAASAGFEYESIELSYRLRHQKEFRDNKKSHAEYIRNRIAAQSKHLKDFRPFAYGEVFYRMNYHKGDRFNAYRLGLGMDWRINKSLRLSGSYTYEEEFNADEPELRNIWGLELSFNLGRRVSILD